MSKSLITKVGLETWNPLWNNRVDSERIRRQLRVDLPVLLLLRLQTRKTLVVEINRKRIILHSVLFGGERSRTQHYSRGSIASIKFGIPNVFSSSCLRFLCWCSALRITSSTLISRIPKNSPSRILFCNPRFFSLFMKSWFGCWSHSQGCGNCSRDRFTIAASRVASRAVTRVHLLHLKKVLITMLTTIRIVGEADSWKNKVVGVVVVLLTIQRNRYSNNNHLKIKRKGRSECFL